MGSKGPKRVTFVSIQIFLFLYYCIPQSKTFQYVNRFSLSVTVFKVFGPKRTDFGKHTIFQLILMGFFYWNPCEKLKGKSFYKISLLFTIFEINGVKGARKGNFRQYIEFSLLDWLWWDFFPLYSSKQNLSVVCQQICLSFTAFKVFGPKGTNCGKIGKHLIFQLQ
jgi:hypothetical protein